MHDLERVKTRAKATYDANRELYNRYFDAKVVLNSDGFHHLQFSSRRERNKDEQRMKFGLVPKAIDVIKRAGTIQEYRSALAPIGKPNPRDGLRKMKNVEYWGLVAIVGERPIRIRVILRRIGDGNITFWSVMPDSKIKNGRQRLARDDIADS